MLIRKLYLKLHLWLYSTRKTFNKIFITFIILLLTYIFFNSFFFSHLLLGKANFEEANKNCPTAITFYTVSYLYYKINHFSEDNQKIYFSLPYKISMCYLKENNVKKSIWSMYEGLSSIQKQYGSISRENAYFIRKYLIEYYLENNKPKLARKEFNNLMRIYQKIGYTNNEMADLIRLSGDLNYQQGNYEHAIDLYEQAYKAVQNNSDIDYAVFARIVYRICDYKIKTGRPNVAIKLYGETIDMLKFSGPKQNEITAEMLMNLGAFYAKEDKNIKEAIKNYEAAIAIIRQLPNTDFLKQNIKEYLTVLKGLYEQDNQVSMAREIDLEITRNRRFSFLY